MTSFEISEKAQENLLKKFEKLIPKWEVLVNKSFLKDETKILFIDIIQQRIKRLI